MTSAPQTKEPTTTHPAPWSALFAFKGHEGTDPMKPTGPHTMTCQAPARFCRCELCELDAAFTRAVAVLHAASMPPIGTWTQETQLRSEIGDAAYLPTYTPRQERDWRTNANPPHGEIGDCDRRNCEYCAQ